MKEIQLLKCPKCSTLLEVINSSEKNLEITCCNQLMNIITPNTADASVEKHKPTYHINNDLIEVVVFHVMEENHFIEWVCYVTENKREYIYLKPGESATVTFKNEGKGIIYSYCNIHGLWMTEIS